MRRMQALLAASERDLGMALAELQKRQQGWDAKERDMEHKIAAMVDRVTQTVKGVTAQIASAESMRGGGAHTHTLMAFS